MTDIAVIPEPTFSGNTSAYTPAVANKLVIKTDNTGGNEGLYRTTGTNAGDVVEIAGGGGGGGGLQGVGEAAPTPLNDNVTPDSVNSLYLQKTTLAPIKTVWWRAVSTTQGDWEAIGGSTVVDTTNTSPIGSYTSDFVGQRYVQVNTSSGNVWTAAFVALAAGVNNQWLQEV